MLYPVQNPFRQVCDLSGFWEIRFDEQKTGLGEGWHNGFAAGRPIAVPASWNEQFEDGRDFLGPAWYQAVFGIPWGWRENNRRIWLRFNSVNYLAEVWLNGKRLGLHEGGHLPFEFDVTGAVLPEGNRLVVRVDGRLAPEHVPPGNVAGGEEDVFSPPNFPDTTFDFFPYCGIQRPVLLYCQPAQAIADVTTWTELDGKQPRLNLSVRVNGAPCRLRARLAGHAAEWTSELSEAGGQAALVIDAPGAKLWSPESPALYDLHIELLDAAGGIIDRYSLAIGLRTVAVDGDRMLLNGEPIRLTGFGRHEDFPVIGRGLAPAVVIKDYALLKWVGANSFRTTHYPYSEQMMDLADRLGFLVIDETPAVGLYFRADGLERRLSGCKQITRELIDRDKNHPSVLMWSLANEPHSARPEAVPFFKELFDLARALDPTRPVTYVSCFGLDDAPLAFCDVLCLNRYLGWYTQMGRIDEGVTLLSSELDVIHDKFNRPVILSEFGADSLPGFHAQPPELFSEEYQAEMIEKYVLMLATKSYIVGAHVWNLCDFKTAQGIMRAGGLNYKGVFTRDRKPKLAAHRLRALWKNER